MKFIAGTRLLVISQCMFIILFFFSNSREKTEGEERLKKSRNGPSIDIAGVFLFYTRFFMIYFATFH